MKKHDYQIPTIYPVNLDQSRSYVGFGLPDKALGQSVYADSDYELMRFLNFGTISKVIDAETDQPYRLFNKNIVGNDLNKALDSACVVLNETTSAVKNLLGSQVEKQLISGNYWRFMVDFPDAEAVGLEVAKLKLMPEFGLSHGPHAALCHREKKAILRVKASTLEQLHQLFEQAQSKLI